MTRKNAVKEEDRGNLLLGMKRTWLPAIVAIAGVLVTGLSCGTPAPTAPPATPRAVRPKKPTVAKQAVQAETSHASALNQYSYDSNGKPDPFVPLIAETVPYKAGTPAPKKKSKPLTPLQKYELKELKLSAIVAAGSSSYALLEDSSGYGYIVREGMLVGNNDGVIKKITPHEVIIEEHVTDDTDTDQTKISTLTIQHEE